MAKSSLIFWSVNFSSNDLYLWHQAIPKNINDQKTLENLLIICCQ